MNPAPKVNAAGKKLWILAGETSGDCYGAELAKALHELAPDLKLAGMGSAQMRAAGVELLVDSTELGVVGLVEVFRHLLTFCRIYFDLARRAASERPAAVVLIDYPGFNLRFAARLRRLGIPVIYYVSPQVWAWGRGRLPRMARMIQRMLTIFPFEPPLYQRVGLRADFVGHPLVDLLRPPADAPAERDPHLVLLLPGSRGGELDRLLGPILDTAEALHVHHPELRFVIPTPRASIRDMVERHLAAHRGRLAPTLHLEVSCGDTHAWMRRAVAGLAASGTVTVESAILGLPLVVVYRVNPLTFLLAKWLVRVPYITMVNLVADEAVFEEFLQDDVRPAVLVPALERILPGGARHDLALAGIAKAVGALRTPAGESASRNAARLVLEELTANAR